MDNKLILEQVKKILDKHLELKGLRKTQERYAIIKEIYSFDHHFDADELYSQMIKKKYRVSRATLYNTIELLLESGLVRKHQFGDSFSQYEKSYFNSQHDHLIITDTGEVKEFCDPRLQEIKKNIEEVFNVDIKDHSLYLYATSKKKNS